ncbi:DUF2683 family protein [Negadavirga shengliensis]|uniref:DUF2683 family protein n=1 Tax=Negadavirga shengliensis TaxID=1389218 RepID=A0ABV9T3Q9_9BACT
METIIIETTDKEQSKTIKAILKAIKVKFKTSGDTFESKRIAESVARGYKEMLEAKAGRLKVRDARDIIDEL